MQEQQAVQSTQCSSKGCMQLVKGEESRDFLLEKPIKFGIRAAAAVAAAAAAPKRVHT